MRPIVFALAGLALLAWMMLTDAPGSVDPLNIQDHRAIPAGQLHDAHTLGQTFVAHSARLSAIQVCWVTSGDFAFAPASRVTFHLRARVDAADDLATVALSLDRIQRERCSIFRFAPQADSAQRAYYFFLDATHADITRGWLGVWASDDDALPDGRAYTDHTPTPYDLAFRAYTAPDPFAALATLCETLARQPALGLIVALLVLLAYRAAPRPIISARQTLVEMMLLAALAFLALGIGSAQFAELPAPLWVDSYQHAADIQALLRGELPLTRVYHFGFHFIVAGLVQLAGMSIPAAMILVGQLIVVQIGLSFFAFGKHWSGSTRVGLVSAIGVWFLAPTPMYFLTWGRYPLLLGTALLPLAFICAMNWLDAPRFSTRAFLLVIITLLALTFAHLRLLAFYVVFVTLYAAWQRAHARRLSALALLAVPAGILWLALLLRQPDGARNLGAVLTFWSGIDLATTFEILRSHYGLVVWTLGAVGLVAARDHARARFIVAWFGTLVILAALFTLIGIPLVEVPFVLLMAFFPATLLIGELARVARAKIGTTRFFAPLEMTVGLLIVLLGAREMLTIFNPTTILFTRADERAMQWIAANTPNDARFLVNAFEWYPNTHVPSDGGAWIPHFTARAIAVAHPATRAAAQYVYLGRRAGILRARDFADASRAVLVYEQEGIRIWRMK